MANCDTFTLRFYALLSFWSENHTPYHIDRGHGFDWKKFSRSVPVEAFPTSLADSWVKWKTDLMFVGPKANASGLMEVFWLTNVSLSRFAFWWSSQIMSLVSVRKGEMLDETSLPKPHKVLVKHHHLRGGGGGQLGSANWRAWSVKYAAFARFTEAFALFLALRYVSQWSGDFVEHTLLSRRFFVWIRDRMSRLNHLYVRWWRFKLVWVVADREGMKDWTSFKNCSFQRLQVSFMSWYCSNTCAQLSNWNASSIFFLSFR